MTIEKLIKTIIRKERNFKGIAIVSIDELSDNKFRLLVENENKEITNGNSKYQIYRDCEFGKFIVVKVDSKKEQVIQMINDIIDCAIGHYWCQWDLRLSMNPKEWKAGLRGVIYNCHGNVIEYIYYEDFKKLYSGFKNNLDGASEKVLDFIIEYLKNENLPYDFHNLDNEKYTIVDIENKLKKE